MKLRSTPDSINSLKESIESVKRGREVTVNREFFLALLIDTSTLYDSETFKLSDNHHERLYEDLNKKTRNRDVVTTSKLALRNCIIDFLNTVKGLNDYSKFEYC